MAGMIADLPAGDVKESCMNMTKLDVVNKILEGRWNSSATAAEAFAPSNIALCKYWGKRDLELNLPLTSSLSISLGKLGSRCRLSLCDGHHDQVILNGSALEQDSPFVRRLTQFLDLFREDGGHRYRVDTENTIPTAAGFASSASGFASLVMALNRLHGWELKDRDLSVLARLGSGSAARSLWQGFVEWNAGSDEMGMDSFAEPLENSDWPDFKIGLLVLEAGRKEIGSREAMQRTVETSELYKSWPQKVESDICKIRGAVFSKDFEMLGSTAESNALAMHATMMAAMPPVLYWLPESVAVMNKVWQCRRDGLQVYFTMDAGPNVKLLFLSQDMDEIMEYFPSLTIAE